MDIEKTECEFEITDRERKALKWIIMGVAHWDIYDVLYPLPTKSFRGTKEGTYTYRPNPEANQVSPMTYVAPEAFAISCDVCGQITQNNFNPHHLDEITKTLSGLAQCYGCQKSYRVWLMDPESNPDYRTSREAWMTPKPGQPDDFKICDYIPEDYSVISQNYKEAKEILDISPRASAALTRLAFEALISEKLNIRERNLSKDIKKIVECGVIPTDLLDEDDFAAIKDIGDISVHIFKHKDTKAVIEVTYQDVALAINILEILLDYCFVRPAQRKLQKQALKEKLKDGTWKS